VASAQANRRARALVAWLSDEDLQRLGGSADDAAHQREAREALARRPAALDQSGLLATLPAALDRHVAALRSSEGAKPMLDNRWELALVTDLRRVVAAQPTVFTEPLSDRPAPSGDRAAPAPEDPAAVAPGDLAAVAHVTLPLTPPAAEIHTRFDEDEQAWRIVSPSPNLRITGTFGGEIEPDVLGVGFLFRVLTSYVSVAELGGRLILRDGYHRAYRLIAAGAVAAPVFVRRFADGESLFRSGMLPERVFLGDRPPTLGDYTDDTVARDVWFADTATTASVRADPAHLAFGRLA
jgi:hypothetical protein